MSYTNKEKIPLSVAVFLAADFYDHNRHPGKKHISATKLLKPIRQTVLSGRLAQAKGPGRPKDLSMEIPNSIGTAIHEGIKRAWIERYKEAMLKLDCPASVIDKIRVNPEVEEAGTIPIYTEKVFSKTFENYIISGEADFICNGALEDFKCTGVFGYMKGNKDDDYIKQGSIYRWLAPSIITHDTADFQIILTDWSKLDSTIKAKSGYPQYRINTKTFKLMSIQETKMYIKGRIRELENALALPETELPFCTQDELWQDHTVFKWYSKPENKRAQKTYKSYEDARRDKGSAGVIREVHGMVKHCNYCDAYTLCSQKDEYLSNGSLKPLD